MQGAPPPYESLAVAKAAGVTSINYGVFINTIITFLIVAFPVFLLIRNINKLKRQEEAAPPVPATKECIYCFSTIPIKATRCPHCTSEFKGAEAEVFSLLVRRIVRFLKIFGIGWVLFLFN